MKISTRALLTFTLTSLSFAHAMQLNDPIDEKSNPIEVSKYDQDFLFFAIEKNAIETIEKIIKHDPRVVNALHNDPDGATPLMYAIKEGKPDAIESFLACENLQIETIDKFGKTALDHAKDLNDKSLVSQLRVRQRLEEVVAEEVLKLSISIPANRCDEDYMKVVKKIVIRAGFNVKNQCPWYVTDTFIKKMIKARID